MAKKRVIEPSQLGRRRRRRRNLKLIIWTVLILLVLSGIVFATHLSHSAITNIKVEGNTFVSEDEIAARVSNELSGNYLHLFSKRNTFIYPKKQIKADILKTYSSVRAVIIDRLDLNSLKVVLEERKPAHLWCQETACYFMDNTGFIFHSSGDFSNDLYFIFYGLITPSNPVGQRYMPEDRFIALDAFLNDIKKLDIEANSLSSVDGSNFELNLKSGGNIRFNVDQPFSQTLANLETVTDKNNQAGTSVDLNQIEYLDLRFGNKIFYKYNNASTTQTY